METLIHQQTWFSRQILRIPQYLVATVARLTLPLCLKWIRNTNLEESALTKSAHAAFRTDLGQKTLIFSPARPVQDDAQQNAQVDCRKVLAPNGPSVLLWSSTRKV